MTRLRTIIPAPLTDVVALYADDGLIKPLAFKCAMLQAARSESIGFVDDSGALVAAAMLYPCPREIHGEDLFELAFACKPEAARHLIAIIHAAHLTRAALADTGTVRVRARVRAGHRPGQRLARLCGLHPIGTEGGFEVYEWASGNEQRGQGRQGPVHRAGYIGE